jgi:hypothetical protein
MRPRDTSPEAWRVYLDLMRKMTPEEKLQRTFEYSAMVRNLARPQIAPMTNPLAQGLNELTRALQKLNIPFAIGGSLASSAHGVLRATFDGDLVAHILPSQARQLSEALGSGWYADPEMMIQAIENGRSFNLIHMASALKYDIFPASSEFDEMQVQRAALTPLHVEGAVAYPVTSAEDILLAKLRWYRDGGEVSERQWNDITGLISANPAMDAVYVENWAARLGVTRLLERARADAAES